MLEIGKIIEASFGPLVYLEEQRGNESVYYLYRLRGDNRDRVYDPLNPPTQIRITQLISRKSETV